MADKVDLKDEIILEVENSPLKCSKVNLMRHSDYFKAMFDGNFIECYKTKIKLEGISLKAMNIILSLLWDKTQTILLEKEDNVISVLQTSCMLQFADIKLMCMEKLIQSLCPQNALKIWLFAEQLDLKNLYLKAKNIALMEFEIIKDLDCLLELELIQLVKYLGNINLQCKTELSVFEACMKWWYENSEQIVDSLTFEEKVLHQKKLLLKLLSCLNFNALSEADIKEIMMYPDLSKNCDIITILECVLAIKNKSGSKFDKQQLNIAKMLLNSKPRYFNKLLCIVARSNSLKAKKLKINDDDIEQTSTNSSMSCFTDMYKRKRYYETIENIESPVCIAFYDEQKRCFTSLLKIEKQKCKNLEGFYITGYKEFIFLFGGQFHLGSGNWNNSFWVYDTTKESWGRKTLMPYLRRHFHCCVCGNYLFIIGGTGVYRIVQENIFWYNYKEDKWSKEISLPCSSRQIQCCSWNDQLLIVNKYDYCGYLFNVAKAAWCRLPICDEKNLIPAEIPFKYSLFSYSNSVYIKGTDQIIELIIKNNKLEVLNCKILEEVQNDQFHSLVIGNAVYTLYSNDTSSGVEEESAFFKLEKFNIPTRSREYVYCSTAYEPVILTDPQYTLSHVNECFTLQHYDLVVNNIYVNDNDFCI